jgi:hypothetical protein
MIKSPLKNGQIETMKKYLNRLLIEINEDNFLPDSKHVWLLHIYFLLITPSQLFKDSIYLKKSQESLKSTILYKLYLFNIISHKKRAIPDDLIISFKENIASTWLMKEVISYFANAASIIFSSFYKKDNFMNISIHELEEKIKQTYQNQQLAKQIQIECQNQVPSFVIPHELERLIEEKIELRLKEIKDKKEHVKSLSL